MRCRGVTGDAVVQVALVLLSVVLAAVAWSPLLNPLARILTVP